MGGRRRHLGADRGPWTNAGWIGDKVTIDRLATLQFPPKCLHPAQGDIFDLCADFALSTLSNQSDTWPAPFKTKKQGHTPWWKHYSAEAEAGVSLDPAEPGLHSVLSGNRAV